MKRIVIDIEQTAEEEAQFFVRVKNKGELTERERELYLNLFPLLLTSLDLASYMTSGKTGECNGVNGQ